MKIQNALAAIAALLILGSGCAPQTTVEQAPPAKQEVVMVPSWKDQEQGQAPPAQPGAGTAP